MVPQEEPRGHPTQAATGFEDAVLGAAGVAVDGAFFVAEWSRIRCFLAGDGFEGPAAWSSGDILTVVEEELLEGGVAIDDVGALGVDVEDVERVRALGELGLDAA